MWNLYKRRNICNLLGCKTCHIIISHLDYANSVLYSASDYTTKKLQRVHNIAVKLVLQYDSSKKALYELYWLPVQAHLDYKLALIMFKCIMELAQKYLRNMLTENVSVKVKNLCSNKAKLYIVPFIKNKTYTARSFSVAGPHIWNSLLVDIRSDTQLDSFKIKLKTHLFSKYFKEFM